jgi:hypothetical protein
MSSATSIEQGIAPALYDETPFRTDSQIAILISAIRTHMTYTREPLPKQISTFTVTLRHSTARSPAGLACRRAQAHAGQVNRNITLLRQMRPPFNDRQSPYAMRGTMPLCGSISGGRHSRPRHERLSSHECDA